MTTTPYIKPWQSLDEQLQLLQNRGMTVTDREKALSCLQRIGYYRLSAYWHPFRESETITLDSEDKTSILDHFREGATFSQVVELYVFDKKLRLLVLDALERIEVNIRVDIAHHLGKKDCFAHMKPELLHGNFTKKLQKNMRTKYSDWRYKLQASIDRSEEAFIKHFREKYSGDLPIWMAIELWDFGLLSTFFQGMQVKDKQIIAEKYGISRWELLEGWLHSMNYIRNVCAHHSRLWNRSLDRRPILPKKGEALLLEHITGHSQIHIYGILAIIQFLLRTINPTSSWGKRLQEHGNSLPQSNGIISLASAGFPDKWDTLPLWNNA